MDRNHIHFSTGLPVSKPSTSTPKPEASERENAVKSGMRGDAELLIYVDVAASMDAGILWWMSSNGVVLTEGDERGMLGTEFWVKVEGRRGDIGVLWEGGKEVGQLPEKFRGRRPPRGKEVGRGGGCARGRGRGGERREVLEGGEIEDQW